MNIAGYTKTSLVDYPGELCTTLFTFGCNMRCPYCHNKELVLAPESNVNVSESEILDFLVKRKNLIQSICITGGEPTLQVGLVPFIETLKSLNFKVKLDTNGLRPDVIEYLTANHLIDYIAMDIKSSKDRYLEASGLNSLDLFRVQKSIEILQNSTIDYEFRTTINKEFHSISTLIEIGNWLLGSKRYVLQGYEKTPTQLSNQVFTPYTYPEIIALSIELAPYFSSVEIRGF